MRDGGTGSLCEHVVLWRRSPIASGDASDEEDFINNNLFAKAETFRGVLRCAKGGA